MRKSALAATAAGLTFVLASPAMAAGTGPFTGTVRQNQTKTHRYDNNPLNNPCPQVIVFYTVTLDWTPAADTLTLSAGGQTATGSGGHLAVSFERGYCTSFDVKVTGTSVASVASYTATVTRGGGAGA